MKSRRELLAGLTSAFLLAGCSSESPPQDTETIAPTTVKRRDQTTQMRAQTTETTANEGTPTTASQTTEEQTATTTKEPTETPRTTTTTETKVRNASFPAVYEEWMLLPGQEVVENNWETISDNLVARENFPGLSEYVEHVYSVTIEATNGYRDGPENVAYALNKLGVTWEEYLANYKGQITLRVPEPILTGKHTDGRDLAAPIGDAEGDLTKSYLRHNERNPSTGLETTLQDLDDGDVPDRYFADQYEAVQWWIEENGGKENVSADSWKYWMRNINNVAVGHRAEIGQEEDIKFVVTERAHQVIAQKERNAETEHTIDISEKVVGTSLSQGPSIAEDEHLLIYVVDGSLAYDTTFDWEPSQGYPAPPES